MEKKNMEITINLGVICLLAIALSMFAFFSEKIICYKDYVSWDSQEKEYVSKINGNGCIIDQEKVSRALGLYTQEFDDSGNGHKILREFVPIWLLGLLVYMVFPKNRATLLEKNGFIKLIFGYIKILFVVLVVLWILIWILIWILSLLLRFGIYVF